MYLHARVPAFHAAVHQAARAQLRARPVAVAVDDGDQAPLFATSVEARAAGVWPGLRAGAARRRCRDLTIVTPEPDWYRRAQAAIALVCQRTSPRIGGQRGCFDIDLAGTERLWGKRLRTAAPLDQAECLAHHLRNRVGADLYCDLRLGAAPRLRVARLAARAAAADDANGVYPVLAEDSTAFIDPLPLSWCEGLGAAARTILTDCGVSTFIQARAVGETPLYTLLGDDAAELIALLGDGDDPEVPELGDPEPAVDAQRHCGAAGADLATALQHVDALARDIGFILRQRGFAATVLALNGRHRDGRTVQTTQRCQRQLRHDDELAGVARVLVTRISRRPHWERLRLTASGLCAAEDQQRLFAPPRSERLEAARDHLRRRFGADCVRPARQAHFP